MRHAEVLAGAALEEVAGDGLARGVGNGVHQAVEAILPVLAHLLHQRIDLGVFGHIAGEDQRRAEFGRQLGDPVLEPVALVGEGQLGPLGATLSGNAVRDGAVGEQAEDQDALAGQKTLVHMSPRGKNNIGIVA